MTQHPNEVNSHLGTSSPVGVGSPPTPPEQHFQRTRDEWMELLRGRTVTPSQLGELLEGRNRPLCAHTLADIDELRGDETAYLQWLARSGVDQDGAEASLPGGYTPLTRADVKKLTRAHSA